jgi:hypothetical protein
MSPAFSNPEPQQFLESIRKLEARLSSLEKNFMPNGIAASSLQPWQVPETIAKLEARLGALEKIFDPHGAGFTLGSGDSSITVNRIGVVIRSRDIELIASGRIAVKAAGQLTLKGAKITEN